jgi:hypothetical protein
VLDERFPELAPRYRALYPEGSYGPPRNDWRPVAQRVRDLCASHRISDRMPSPAIPGDKGVLNKRSVEALANQVYGMELSGEPGRRVWAYRKVAWAIEDTLQHLGLIYRQMGVKALEGIENVGPRLAKVVEALLGEMGVL